MIKYLLLLFPLVAIAGGNNSTVNNYTTNNYTTELIEIDGGVNDDELAEAVAKSAACDHSFYFATYQPQLSVQGAYYDGQSELCVGGAWRPADSNLMLNLSIAPDEDTDKMLIQGGFLVVF